MAYNLNSSKQSTDQLLMVRPAKFGFNSETAEDNAFQQKPSDFISKDEIHQKALNEFDSFVEKLRGSGITVHVIKEMLEPNLSSDSIFPNNWISFHEEDATICIYPMAAPSRRLERKSKVLKQIEETFHLKSIVDMTRFENYGQFLEGTGSMVLDRVNHIAYASISIRTNEELLKKFCKLFGYSFVIFHSVDDKNLPIYHTNVMMTIADKYAVVCFESIQNELERSLILKSLEKSGKTIIKLAYKQMNSFAGNMLQVRNKMGKTLLIMSTQAYVSLDFEQIAQIEKFDTILHSELSTVEKYGGGSARCMMAEIFLQEKI